MKTKAVETVGSVSVQAMRRHGIKPEGVSLRETARIINRLALARR